MLREREKILSESTEGYTRINGRRVNLLNRGELAGLLKNFSPNCIHLLADCGQFVGGIDNPPMIVQVFEESTVHHHLILVNGRYDVDESSHNPHAWD